MPRDGGTRDGDDRGGGTTGRSRRYAGRERDPRHCRGGRHHVADGTPARGPQATGGGDHRGESTTGEGERKTRRRDERTDGSNVPTGGTHNERKEGFGGGTGQSCQTHRFRRHRRIFGDLRAPNDCLRDRPIPMGIHSGPTPDGKGSESLYGPRQRRRY